MKVLIVDDSSSIRKSIRTDLKQEGYDVFEAVNGNEALDLVEQESIFSLIITDINLSDMTGYVFVQIIRTLESETKADVPVVFIAKDDSIENRQKALALGAHDFIDKTVLNSELIKAVNNIVNPDKTLFKLKSLVINKSSEKKPEMINTLKKKGVEITTIEDTKAAFSLICEKDSQIEIILILQDQADRSFLEFTTKVRKELGYRDLPIILFTEKVENDLIIEFFKAGGTDCILFPLLDEHLLAKLKIHLQNIKQKAILQRYVQEMKKADQAKDDFISVCSHDLKSPLCSIVGFADLIINNESSTPDIKEDARKIETAANLLVKLIHNIFDIVTIASDKMELNKDKVDLMDILKYCHDVNLGFAGRKEVDIILEPPNNTDTSILGNKLALTRCFNNLITNAIKFTPKKGSIKVSVLPQQNRFITTITDTGVGMSKEIKDKLFTRFINRPRSGTEGEKGTGLGLAIVKEIVEQHGGEITVESQENSGTTFTVNLPIFRSKV